MVNIGSILDTILTIVLNLADHVIVVAVKYTNKRVILHPIALIVIFILIQTTLIIYLLSSLVFMSLIHQHQQRILLIVYRLSGLEIQVPRITWHLILI
jgi:hypothetical protein